MTFLFGFLGGLAVVGLLALGALAGWKAHKAFARPKAGAPEKAELDALKAQQQAFRELSNYSMETAYGMRDAGGDS